MDKVLDLVIESMQSYHMTFSTFSLFLRQNPHIILPWLKCLKPHTKTLWSSQITRPYQDRPYYPEQRAYAPPTSRATMEPDLYSYRRPPQRATSTYRPYESYDENPNTFLDR